MKSYTYQSLSDKMNWVNLGAAVTKKTALKKQVLLFLQYPLLVSSWTPQTKDFPGYKQQKTYSSSPPNVFLKQY